MAFAALCAFLATGCALTPIEGETADANDRTTYTGGTPFPGSLILIECRVANSTAYQVLGVHTAPTTLDPNLTPSAGNYYVVQEYVTIPSTCWFADDHAQLRIRNYAGEKMYTAFTYDEEGIDCLNEAALPVSANDYANCSQNSTGLITVCRYGTSWNGTSCI